MGDTVSWSSLTAALLLGYVLGSLPLSYLVARARGVNIFEVGTGQAGATNVWREVDRWLGFLVFLLDGFKGVGAIAVARLLGLEGAWLMLPALTVTMGHWNSLFTGFRGGDGISTAWGVVAALMGWAIVVPVLIFLIVTMVWNSKLSHPTVWGGLAAYIALVLIAQTSTFEREPVIVLGAGGLVLAVLLHNTVYHRRVKARQQALLDTHSHASPEGESGSGGRT